jgi:5-methyltetrahydropteroyltriglutamate--homocysteine methyltransferase
MSEDDFLKVAAANVEALNAATANIPPERMRMHVCWGNYEGPHDHDIPLERVIDIVLKARPSTVLFEAANPRHEHEWRVWEHVKLPAGRVLLPGCITHASVIIEHPELVAERVLKIAKIVGRESVMASSDCGFASTLHPGQRPEVEPEIVWAKFESLAEGARIATKELWG